MKQKQLARKTVLATLVLSLTALSLIEFAIHTALRKGWTTSTDYPGASFFTVDERGWLWAVIQDSLILYPDEGEPVQMPLPDLTNELTSDYVVSMAIDKEAQVWVGTLTSRIGIRDASGEWTLYYPEVFGEPFEGLNIMIDGQGRAWAWTRNLELSRIHLNDERKIYTLASPGLENIEAIAFDDKRQCWTLSSSGELKVLAPDGVWKTHTYVKKEDPDAVSDDLGRPSFSAFGYPRLTVDKQGQIWIGTGNGVIHVLGLDGIWRSYAPDDPHPAIRRVSIVVDDQGQMWGVSGHYGLYRFDPEIGWVAYNTGNSALPSIEAGSLRIDKQGRVWIQTDGGVSIFDPASALPMQNIPALSKLALIVLPAALFSLALVTVWTIIFMRPGTTSTSAIRDFLTITLGAFCAAVFGIYVADQRNRLADQIMGAVFGDGWAFNDGLVFIGNPILSMLLVPVSAAAGAAIGILVVRFSVRIFRK